MAQPRGALAGSRFTAPMTVGAFEATVHSGPDTGLSLRGTLRLGWSRDNQLLGLLARTSGPAVPVSGQLNGVAINLVFYLAHNRHLFGVGTIGHDPGTKHWFVGGPLVGPERGDSGDWDVASVAISFLVASPRDANLFN
jgi:hypothetical protein